MQNVVPLNVRRRQETWHAIHEAAAEAALSDGVEKLTTGRIAELSGISPRTLFNYFACKEDAVLGLRTPELSEQVVAEFLADPEGSALLRAARLLSRVVATAILTDVDLDRRRELVGRHEELRQRLVYTVVRARDLVLAATERAEDNWWKAAGMPASDPERRTLVMLASTVATLSWLSDREKLRPPAGESLNETITVVANVLQGSL